METPIHDDLLAPEVIANPYPYLAHLRETDPVHWNELHETWVITRYDDFLSVTRQPELFSSEVARRSPPSPTGDAAERALHDKARDVQSNHMAQRDADEHMAMRKVVNAFFSPRALERWRPRMQAILAGLLDRVQEQGETEVEVLRQVAMPLDIQMISEMMGFPEDGQAELCQLADQLCALNRGEPDRIRVFMEGMAGFKDYLSPFVEDRLAHPGEDLLSLLVRGEQDGVYTRDQVLANASVMLIAGQETTANLIGNSLLAFLRHPDQWQRFQQDQSSKAVARAVNECLRYDAPQKSVQRIATEDVELRGKSIRQGDRVRCFISSANRDPEMFEAPDTFDITRYPNRHVAFGFGSHY
jgi:cytochrome P450